MIKPFFVRNIIGGVLFILLIVTSIVWLVGQVEERHEAAVVTNQIATQVASSTHDYSPELAGIQAKAYFVYDLTENKVLFAKNEQEQLPLASVTKLMAGFVIMNNLPVSTTVSIESSDLGYDGNGGKLLIGEKWTPQSLLNFSLIMSSNDGIMALSRTLDTYEGQNASNTVALMNHEAQVLGMHSTVFLNPTGLDLNATTSGAYSSAYDITTLLAAILKQNPVLVSKTNKPSANFMSLSNVYHTTINTDLSIKYIPGLIASKTGYTDLAGGNLAVVYDAGLAHPIISVVLGSTEDGRFTDMETLVHVTLEKLSE
jgi:D-alanyl-D-alanine carboxypeptidase